MQMPRHVRLLHRQNLLDETASVPSDRRPPQRQIRRSLTRHLSQWGTQQKQGAYQQAPKAPEDELYNVQQYTRQKGKQEKATQIRVPAQTFQSGAQTARG